MLTKKRLRIWLNFILNGKLSFNYPKKNKILIFDKVSSETGCKILGLKKYQILYTRKEVLCFPILVDLLLKFKLNSLNYYIKYIELSDPKIVITFIDNNFIFYQLKKYFRSKKFISIQNGHRMAYGDIFGFLQKNKKIKNLSADMIFTFNKNIMSEYKKKISSKFQAIGSLKNNHVKVGKIIKKKTKFFIVNNYMQTYHLLAFKK